MKILSFRGTWSRPCAMCLNGPMSPCHCRCKSVVAASRVSMHAEAHVDGVMDFKRFDAESGRLM